MYTDKLDADEQITVEESIASLIKEAVEATENSLTDEDCGDLGRLILKQMLEKFRPDLIEQ